MVSKILYATVVALYFILVCVCLQDSGHGYGAEVQLRALVRSDRNFTSIKMQTKKFILDEDSPFEQGNQENDGFLITVFNQITGHPMISAQHLQLFADLQWLIRFLENIQPGRIIILALRGDLAYVLPSNIKKYLEKIGSFAWRFLRKGMTWSWAFIKGGKTFFEVVSFPMNFKMAAASLADIRTVLSPESTTCPNWPHGIQWSQRRKFCDTYEKYGDLCWCENVYSLEVNPLQIENSQIESAVTAAVAHRASMFYESLKTLFANPGFKKSRLEVFTQEPQKEHQDLLRLLDIKLTVTGMVTEGVANTIMRQFIFAISHILKKYPGTEFFIFIEDDLHFSPDFFIFLNRTAEMLLQDATLYCVSAHNDLSYPHTSYDASALLRTESFPNYGWMVRREFVVQMLKTLENSMHVEADWDIIIFHYLRGNRECIVPEISRSHHFGEGYHINQYQMNLFYAHKNYNLDPSALVEHVHLMEQNSYEKILSELLNKSVPLDLTNNPPCSENFYHALNSSENSVITIFFNLTDLAHYRGTVPYYILTECLEVYSTESREGHFGLFRMRWENKHLILIGYPASNYSFYKPNELPVFNGSDELQAESQRHFYSKPKNAYFVLDEPANYYKDFLRAN